MVACDYGRILILMVVPTSDTRALDKVAVTNIAELRKYSIGSYRPIYGGEAEPLLLPEKYRANIVEALEQSWAENICYPIHEITTTKNLSHTDPNPYLGSTIKNELYSVSVSTVESHSDRVKEDLFFQLDELRTVGANWNGYGADAASQSALKWAVKVIEELDAPESVVTEAGLLSDGCISFEFYDSEDDLLGALDVLDDGSVSFALSINDIADTCGSFSLKNSNKLDVFFINLRRAATDREQKNSD